MNSPTLLTQTPFYKFLTAGIDKGGFTNDDVVAIVIPLFEQISAFHETGKVAPLYDLSHIEINDEKLDIHDSAGVQAKNNITALYEILPNLNRVFEVTGVLEDKVIVGGFGSSQTKNLSIQTDLSKGINTPVYLPNYQCFEFLLNHHDAAGDIFVLGLILGSLALNLDLTFEADLENFVENRESMIFLNRKIHPSIANITFGMTELDRRKRWKDLREIIDDLKNYKDYNPEVEHDLAKVVPIQETGKYDRNQLIHSKLRNRLFDHSRRNKLLYYKPSLKFLNLTVSSVPSVLNYKNIKPDELFFWHDEIAQKIIKAKEFALSKYLAFDDNAYIAPTLDKIRLEANKDINEYGFSQLKLVVAFLHWYNPKENPTEKISSPLVLVPVKLFKKKGLKTQYTMEALDGEAEINPVLANLLKELYGIKLPVTLALTSTCLNDLFEKIKLQIEKNRSGVQLILNDKPKIKIIHAQAEQTRLQYTRKNGRNKNVNSFHHINYSYSTEHYQPLGIELFKQYVRSEPSPLEFLINDNLRPNAHFFNSSRELYQIDEGNSNPFKWEFDTCNIVLGNFNYKKMSLVRDFNTIIEEKTESEVFESLFSPEPKILSSNTVQEYPIEERFSVVQSDPSQNKAVAYSRRGESYIIQGPPGTGKSQTISNLIADYIVRGKKVLFVCEKRAAIDVVYHRLKQQHLDELCSLIHDSQTDKKEFILDLKASYERALNRKKPTSRN